MPRARPPAALLALLAVAALGGIAWSLVLPAFQGPDEASHVAAVERLVERGVLIPRASEGEALPAEVVVVAREAGLGPLVGNLDARPSFTPLDEARWRRADAELGDRRHEPMESTWGLPVQGANRNPPLYALYEAPVYAAGRGGSILARVQLMRLWNVPLLLVAVVCTWLLAREVLPGRPWAAALAAGIVAVQPQLSFLTGTVNPDVLLTALGAAFLLGAVRLVRRGPSAGGVAAVAVAAGLAALTHPRGMIFVVVALVALALSATGRPVAPRRAAIVGAVSALVVGALVAAGVLAANRAGVALLGGSTTPDVGAPFSVRGFVSYVWQFYLPRLPFMDPSIGGDYGAREAWVETMWGTFASLEVQFPSWVYTLVGVVMLGALAAAVVAVLARIPGLRRRWREAALLVAVVAGYLLALHLGAYRTLLVDRTDPVLVGRHALPLLPLLAIAVAVAVHTAGRRAAPVLAGALLGGVASLELAGLGLTLARFTL